MAGKIRVASLNIARLGPHMEDIKIDPTLLKADVIHLCETWIHPNQEGQAQFQLDGFTARFVSVGDGRGLRGIQSPGGQGRSELATHQVQL